MTDRPDLWARLRQARVVRVLVVYLGASWIVLQVAQTIVDAFKLPDWVLPSAIILLLIGLVVIGATAWVQSQASTTAGEESGALPGDWEIAPGDVISSIRKGRLPHLTWGRSIAGGVAMLILLFAGAGGYAGFTRLHLGGAAPASASEAATGIAIVPFDVRGTGLEIWREGMMDLLSHGLDGVGGFRAIDTRTVLARWNDRVGDKVADKAATMDVARATGARYALVGSVVALGPSVRMATTVYDVVDGKEVGRGQVEGPVANVLQLADELAVETLRSLLTSIGKAGAADDNAETISTKSLPAVRAYLEGERFYRKGQFAEAVQSYEKAVAEDSTFAIALVELSEAYGWLENDNSVRMVEVGRRAFAQKDKLSPRYQFIMTGWDALNRHSSEGVASLKEAVRKYPDDARAWFLLAETYLHVGGSTYYTDEELHEALQKATTLDNGFAPYLVHVAEDYIVRGQRDSAQAAIDRYVHLTGDHIAVSPAELAMHILLGTDAEADAAIKSAATSPANILDQYNGTFNLHHNHPDRDAAMDAAMATAMHTNRAGFQAYYAGAGGALKKGAAAIADPTVTPTDRAIYSYYIYDQWDVMPPADVLQPSACPATHILCNVYLGRALTKSGHWPEHQKLIAQLRAASAAATDTMQTRLLNRTAEIVRGMGLREHGDLDGARAIMNRYAGQRGAGGGDVARYELALIDAQTRHYADALRNFNSIRTTFSRPAALYGMAAMYEQLGQVNEAREYYTSFLAMTSKGDDLPRIANARAALARLQPKD